MKNNSNLNSSFEEYLKDNPEVRRALKIFQISKEEYMKTIDAQNRHSVVVRNSVF